MGPLRLVAHQPCLCAAVGCAAALLPCLCAAVGCAATWKGAAMGPLGAASMLLSLLLLGPRLFAGTLQATACALCAVSTSPPTLAPAWSTSASARGTGPLLTGSRLLLQLLCRLHLEEGVNPLHTACIPLHVLLLLLLLLLRLLPLLLGWRLVSCRLLLLLPCLLLRLRCSLRQRLAPYMRCSLDALGAPQACDSAA